MSTPDLAAALVDRLERLQTPSAGVMRSKVYELLAGAGIDVGRLALDARSAVEADVRAKLDRCLELKRRLQHRVRMGLLPADKAGEAEARLARVPKDIKAQKEILRKLEARPKPLSHAAPTRELIRHMGQQPIAEDSADGQPLSGTRHRFEWPIDRATLVISAEEYQSAVRLRQAFEFRTNHAKVQSWGDAGGGSPGSRLPITDRQLKASREFNAIWHRLNPSLRLICTNFVFQQAPAGQPRPMTAEEFGRTYGNTQDARRARGVTDGALRTLCAVLASLFAEYDEYKRAQAAGATIEHRDPGRVPRMRA